MIQTPSGTPKRDLSEAKSSQDSLLSMDSSSPPQKTSQDDVGRSTTDPPPSTPIPNHPQLSIHDTSSTPIAAGGLVPKMLNLTPVNPQTSGKADNPQTIIYPQQTINPLLVCNHPQPVYNPQQVGRVQPANNPRPFNNLLLGSNPQLPGIPQQLTRVNGPVLLRFVSPSGEPVRHVLLTGQQMQLLTQQMANVGQQVMPMAGVVHLAGVNQGIRLNMAGQPGLNTIGQPRFQGTLRVQGVPQKDFGGQCSTPGVVRIKEEPKSPSDEVQAQCASWITAGVNQGLNTNQESRMHRRPLFSSNNSELNHPSGDALTGVGNEWNADMCWVNNHGDDVVPENVSPDSPLLFCTPPTSFESDDGTGVDGENGGSEGVKKGREKMDVFDGAAETDDSNVRN